MVGRLMVSLVVMLSLSGCGGGDTSAPDGESSTAGSADATPDVSSSASAAPSESAGGTSYFTSTDSDAINTYADPALQATARALQDKQIDRCDRAAERSYPAWRACFHELLDPIVESLSGLESELGSRTDGEFSVGCREQLAQQEKAVGGFRRDVLGLLRDFDSDEATAQERAAGSYFAVLTAISEDYAAVFEALTGDCYSPEDLARLESATTLSG